MDATAKAKREVTLPEGVSLKRLAQVLLDAWEADPRRWMNAPTQLHEGAESKPAMPVPQDAMELFRLLAERRVPYLLVGGLAMLTYVQGRNTKDVDLLLSVEALGKVPELEIKDRQDFFIRAQFRSVQVDLLLTINPLFKLVADKFATRHSFEELSVPTATVEGMILLKLFALPSLYRQLDWDRVYVYESDIKLLMARHKPDIQALFKVLEPHVLPTDLRELRRVVAEEQQRVERTERSGRA